MYIIMYIYPRLLNFNTHVCQFFITVTFLSGNVPRLNWLVSKEEPRTSLPEQGSDRGWGQLCNRTPSVTTMAGDRSPMYYFSLYNDLM